MKAILCFLLIAGLFREMNAAIPKIEVTPAVQSQLDATKVRTCVLWRKDGFLVRFSMYPQWISKLIVNYDGSGFDAKTQEVGFMYIEGSERGFVGVYIISKKIGKTIYLYDYTSSPKNFIEEVLKNFT